MKTEPAPPKVLTARPPRYERARSPPRYPGRRMHMRVRTHTKRNAAVNTMTQQTIGREHVGVHNMWSFTSTTYVIIPVDAHVGDFEEAQVARESSGRRAVARGAICAKGYPQIDVGTLGQSALRYPVHPLLLSLPAPYRASDGHFQTAHQHFIRMPVVELQFHVPTIAHNTPPIPRPSCCYTLKHRAEPQSKRPRPSAIIEHSVSHGRWGGAVGGTPVQTHKQGRMFTYLSFCVLAFPRAPRIGEAWYAFSYTRVTVPTR